MLLKSMFACKGKIVPIVTVLLYDNFKSKKI